MMKKKTLGRKLSLWKRRNDSTNKPRDHIANEVLFYSGMAPIKKSILGTLT